MTERGEWTKRVLDVLGASVGLVVLSPILAAVALVIRMRLGTPVLFRQQRPGYGGRPFMLVKFRSMLDISGPDGEPLPDDARMTGLGRRLRSTSIDELPTLWNVLRGDMSLVGPRPLLMEYLPRYSAEQMRRHEVKPGMTGWAQANGRNTVSWEKKFELDVWYVDNRSLWLDLKILAMTVINVLRRDGISQPGRATVDPFGGSDV
jgi:lipopolysaccharide/colanic/teichoic acid biosynthesis glycosyltransferase